MPINFAFVRPRTGIFLRHAEGLLPQLATARAADRIGHVHALQLTQNPMHAGPQPTLPSSEMPISFCVSAMNSIGNCCSTSRTKPFTISATASSSDSPRCLQ